jgi:predicted CXXCH cytochrome family protein
MVVTTTTCFLCHFKDGLFNEGLGRCTRCHQIPDKRFDLGGGIMFSHDLAYERGVDCANCHGDLIRGKGEVPHERCIVCHNREEDLKRIGDDQFMHEKHVTEHKIDCLECHLAIQHSKDRDKIVHAASDCTSCHPDHHHEQVQMLEGVGAKSVPAQTAGMLAIRVECRTCHRMREVSSTGTVLWRSSAQVCTACHDAAAIPKFEAYEAELKAAIKEMASAVGRIREALKSAALKEDRTPAVRAQVDNLEHDLDFLRVANGIHNIHYASTLTGTLLERVTALCRELKIPEPKAMLPRPLGNVKEPPHDRQKEEARPHRLPGRRVPARGGEK